MNRREALSRVGILLGGTVIGAEVFLSGCKNAAIKAGTFSPEIVALLDEVGETIIPTTPDSPGAKAAQIGNFMKTIVTDCYRENEQKAFHEGVGKLQEACEAKYKKGFNDLSATEKTAFLTELDKEAKAFSKTDAYKKEKEAFDAKQDEWVKAEEAKKNFGAVKLKQSYPPHYFTMLKQLTLWGYFTSKPGAEQALRYIETPGKFDGAYPYKKGDKAWAL
ncbi:gluconate 2-dehydrogenase subunit 3 family protein [Niabella pedocola]|uniref:Gluconate 2-dehydrogenase subunit 3 family protein n=1 Tax=Niabella pedocola TaxID=1752077 RepID=A0ABS8PMP5_9BACT|nr:gluconate 2-dehydrogenase subunit 3 family protein [Niabella pedocola]MCD2422373.1 gluconate 2-dehydrogenase subunit 3 family protein [Niabella pedocola]